MHTFRFLISIFRFVYHCGPASVTLLSCNRNDRYLNFSYSSVHSTAYLSSLPFICPSHYPSISYFSHISSLSPFFSLFPSPTLNLPSLAPFFHLFLAANSHTHPHILHLTIRYHIMYHFSDTIGKAGPVAWMVELFGPLDGSESFENDYFANAVNSLSSNGDGRKNGVCVHEDGGRFAVFQSTEGDAVRGREHIALLHTLSFHSISVTLISDISSYLSPSPPVLSFLLFLSEVIFSFESVPWGL